jgi:flagellar motor protein MotB
MAAVVVGLVAIVNNGCAELKTLRRDNSELKKNVASLQRRSALAEQSLSEARNVIATQGEEYGAQIQRQREAIEQFRAEARQFAADAAARETELVVAIEEERRIRTRVEADLATAAASTAEQARLLATSQEELREAQRVAQQAEEISRQTREQLARAEKQVADAEQRLAEMESAAVESAAAASEASRHADAIAAAADRLRADTRARWERAFAEDGGDALRSLEGQLVELDTVTALVVPADRLFTSGSIILDEKMTAPIRLVAAAMANATWPEGWRFAIVGHTDNVPIQALPVYNNTELGFRRAFSVARVLSEEGGFPEPRLEVRSPGEHQPRGSNRTPEGRRLNRRVAIVPLPPPTDAFSDDAR